ncbi:MAG: hypothetical protein KC731_34900 [Myxococcales bacterium]|nr:hypothetical protein [Myxococcales bacterium]
MSSNRPLSASLVAIAFLSSAQAGAAEPYGFVANKGSDTVTVLSLRLLGFDETVPVGAGPCGVAADSEGRWIYVTNHDDDTVSVIDGASMTVTHVAPVEKGPCAVHAHPDGYVVVAHDDGSFRTLQASASGVASGYHNPMLDTPQAIAFSPDGATTFVIDRVLERIFAFDTSALHAPVADFGVGNQPLGVDVDPDTGEIFVASYGNGSPTSGVVLRLEYQPGGGFTLLDQRAVAQPTSVVVNPSWGGFPAKILVTSSFESTRIFDSSFGQYNVLFEDHSYYDPYKLAVSPDGYFTYVLDKGASFVEVIDRHTDQFTGHQLPVGDNPVDIDTVSQAGARVVLSPNPLIVHYTQAGVPSSTETLTLENLSHLTPAKLQAVSVSYPHGSDPVLKLVNDTCANSTVRPHGSCTIDIACVVPDPGPGQPLPEVERTVNVSSDSLTGYDRATVICRPTPD